MKTLRMVCLLALSLGPQLVWAETYIDPWMLGVVEGAVDYCARVDPRTAGRLQDLERNLLNNLPKKELSSARTTKAYDIGQSVGKGIYADLPKPAMLTNCTDFTNHFMAEASVSSSQDSRDDRNRGEKESRDRH